MGNVTKGKKGGIPPGVGLLGHFCAPDRESGGKASEGQQPLAEL